MDDLTEKVQSSQNKLEDLVKRIPGYAGYKQKEQRREADKLLRLHVARKYEEQARRLNDLQFTLTTRGQLIPLMTLERAGIKLQLLVDRLKNASYGYAGLFDTVKIDEAALDRLYDFDEKMLEGVGQVASLLDTLEDAIHSEASIGTEASALVAQIQELNDTYSRRQDVVLGSEEPGTL
jgi:hypothetical protein